MAKIDICMILKDNCSVVRSGDWLKRIDKTKLINVSLCHFYQICGDSNLKKDEIIHLKNLRRRAQKCRSSLKSQAKVKKKETRLEKKVELLCVEKNKLQQELFSLCQEVHYYQSFLPQ